LLHWAVSIKTELWIPIKDYRDTRGMSPKRCATGLELSCGDGRLGPMTEVADSFTAVPSTTLPKPSEANPPAIPCPVVNRGTLGAPFSFFGPG
jgi:hypothetical protein